MMGFQRSLADRLSEAEQAQIKAELEQAAFQARELRHQMERQAPLVVHPVPMPREFCVSTIGEMEPGERGWCCPGAVEVDLQGQVWLDVACNVLPRQDAARDYVIAVRCFGCLSQGFEIGIPQGYRFPRHYRMQHGPYAPVVKIEGMPQVSDEEESEDA